MNGRCIELTPTPVNITSNSSENLFKLQFKLDEYWRKFGGIEPFFPIVEILFNPSFSSGSRYHVPLVVTPFAYSTYRGT